MDAKNIPTSIEIAARCKALDKVKAVPFVYENGAHSFNPEIRVLMIGNWERRLINKSIKHLTETIEYFCGISVNKPIFKAYTLCNLNKEGIWMYNDMRYDIQTN
jgi:hypothetical protein